MTPASTLRRPLILASVMAAFFMIAIEATIVSTAMPQIAGQLGDLHLYSWVFSAFLLTQTALSVVFGKLADVYGRQPVLLAGIGIFLVGSVLCGLAWSMPSLIVFRLVQGIGAGAIQPVSLTVVGDLYSVEERGKVQGYLASVWGISSVLGPLAGGVILQHLSWSWIFWINVPVGLLAAAGFIAYLREGAVRRTEGIDVPGATLFIAVIASLMIVLTEVGTTGHGTSMLVAGGVCAASLVLLVLQERRAAHPMLDLRLWTRRPIATANAATLVSGMTIIGLTTFLPMYVQGVLSQSALIAGFALTVMVLGWPIGATLAARNFTRFGLRPVLLFGGCLLPVGALAFVTLGLTASPFAAAAGSAVMGLGMGFLSTTAIVIVQESVGWAERGAATASNIFSRNLGSTLGAAVLGAVLNASLSHAGAQQGGISSDQIRRLLDQAGTLDGAAAVRAALSHAIGLTFWVLFGLAVLTLLLALLVPPLALTPGPREVAVE